MIDFCGYYPTTIVPDQTYHQTRLFRVLSVSDGLWLSTTITANPVRNIKLYANSQMFSLLARRSIIRGGWTPALVAPGQRVSVPVAMQQTGRKIQCSNGHASCRPGATSEPWLKKVWMVDGGRWTVVRWCGDTEGRKRRRRHGYRLSLARCGLARSRGVGANPKREMQ